MSHHLRRPIGLFVLILLAACGFSGDGADRPGNWLLMNVMADPAQLDPALVTSVEDHRVQLALFEGLVAHDPKTLDPEPGVALSWSISDDGLEYRFQLREDAAWSDGRPLNAEDFLWSWRRVLTPPGHAAGSSSAIASPYAELLFDIAGAEDFYRGTIRDFAGVGIVVSSRHELIVRLRRPTAWFLELLAFPTFMPTPRHVIEKWPRSWTRPEHFVGNGAYRVAVRRPGDRLEVVRNRYYWDRDRAQLDGIVYFSTDQIDTALDQYLAGETDWVRTMNPKKIRAWKKDATLGPALRSPEFLGTYFFRLNVQRPPLDKVLVRRALARAIDRKSLVVNLLGLGEEPALGLVAPCVDPMGKWPKITEAEGLSFDPARARKDLAAAGFLDGRGFPEITLAYNTDVKNKALAEAVQQMWRRHLNIRVRLENREKRVHLALERAGDYDVSRGSWIGDYRDPTTFLDFMASDRSNNRTGWKNKAYDDLLEKARGLTDQGERYRALAEAERILMVEEAVLLPLFYYRTIFILRPHFFEGIYENARDLHPPKYIRKRGA